MKIEIITPEKQVYAGDTTMVRLPGTLGSFQILNNHAPIVSTLEKGKVTVRRTDGSEIDFEISGGLVECKKNHITVLAE